MPVLDILGTSDPAAALHVKPLGLLIRVAERTAVEALLVRSRRLKPGAEDPVILAVIVGSVVVLPVLAALFAVRLITGRGPAMRILAWGAGGPRQRPPR